MTTAATSTKVSNIQSKIINTVRLIDATKLAKKESAKSFSDDLSVLQGELDKLMEELETTQRAELDAKTDKILAPELAESKSAKGV